MREAVKCVYMRWLLIPYAMGQPNNYYENNCNIYKRLIQTQLCLLLFVIRDT